MSRSIFVLSIVLFCAGCPKKDGGGGDAASEAAAASASASATPAPPVDPTAKNESKVARYSGETKLANEKDKVLADSAVVREGPGNGGLVATLKKGTEVTKQAQNGDYTLVLFADPKAPSDFLLGWMHKSGFVASPPPSKKTCAAGQVAFAGIGCQVDCSKDGTCPAGMTCTGYGSRPELGDGAFQYCEALSDAGPHTVVDAGPAKGADAGKAITCPIDKEAIVISKDPVCRKRCKDDSNCKGAKKGSCQAFTSVQSGKSVSICVDD